MPNKTRNRDTLLPLSEAGEDRNGWLKLSEAASYTPLSYQGFYLRAVKKAELHLIQPGGTGAYYVHRDELSRWLGMGSIIPAQCGSVSKLPADE